MMQLLIDAPASCRVPSDDRSMRYQERKKTQGKVVVVVVAWPRSQSANAAVMVVANVADGDATKGAAFVAAVAAAVVAGY